MYDWWTQEGEKDTLQMQSVARLKVDEEQSCLSIGQDVAQRVEEVVACTAALLFNPGAAQGVRLGRKSCAPTHQIRTHELPVYAPDKPTPEVLTKGSQTCKDWATPSSCSSRHW